MRLASVFLRCFSQRCKSFRFIGGHVRQHFTVNLDARLVKAVHETTICRAVLAGGRVNTLNPKGAELALL